MLVVVILLSIYTLDISELRLEEWNPINASHQFYMVPHSLYLRKHESVDVEISLTGEL